MIAAILMTLVYECILRFLVPTNWEFIQHQEQANLVKAQNFLYGTKACPEKIIVGTSLSMKLHSSSSFNMAFAGQSIYDGLELLRHSRCAPKFLFIETNALFKPLNRQFIQTLLGEPFYSMRNHVMLLREAKQPIAAGGYALQKSGTGWLFIASANKMNNELENSLKSNHSSAFTQPKKIIVGLAEKLAQAKASSYAHPPQADSVKYFLQLLRHYTDQFESKGSTIVFFEVPTHSAIASSPYVSSIRQNLRKAFGKPCYKWIPLPSNLLVKTSDGIHLTDTEMDVFVRYFDKQISVMLSSNK